MNERNRLHGDCVILKQRLNFRRIEGMKDDFVIQG